MLFYLRLGAVPVTSVPVKGSYRGLLAFWTGGATSVTPTPVVPIVAPGYTGALYHKKRVEGWVPVESSNIGAIKYSDNKLNVEFKSGSEYQYVGVPENKHKALLKAKSHGKYMHRNIRNQYNYRKV